MIKTPWFFLRCIAELWNFWLDATDAKVLSNLSRGNNRFMESKLIKDC